MLRRPTSSNKSFSFSYTIIVSCGTLSLELSYLREAGFLDAQEILCSTPGFHQDCKEPEHQLMQRIAKAEAMANKVIVVYGGKFCYVNINNSNRTMEKIISQQGPGATRIDASHCMDMLASEVERERITQGEKICWMTPGWIKFRHQVFKGWDNGIANENFPRDTGGAIVLDDIGYFDQCVEEHPEDLLEYSDWTRIPIQAHPVSLERFKSLLVEQLRRLRS